MAKGTRFWLVLLAALLMLQSLAHAGKQTVPDPTPVSETDGVSVLGGGSYSGSPGTWYVGATPPNVDYDKPVLVFVHGKGGSAEVWWGETAYHGTNDMYAYAYNNGYRTAFVDLYPDRSMWDNGYLLNQLLDRIRSYFGVSKVAIVAHSKGGVDTNAASVHYGATEKVNRVITLGTPHWGTPLADLAYSTWTWWLAELLGERNDATYVMQTGYMEYFRSITDGRDPTLPYYTLSGYKCGPVFSALWWGCVTISGEDDGVVPVWSARKPGGTHLKEGYWDHDEIRMGSRTWSTFAPYIQTAAVNERIAAPDPAPAVALAGDRLAMAQGPIPDAGRPGDSPEATPGNLILRGGEVEGTATGQSFPVESGVRSITFTFYASNPEFTATLTAPDGSSHQVETTTLLPEEHIFGGAWAGSITVESPAAGLWALAATAESRTGYLMVAALDSDLQANLDVGNGIATPGRPRSLLVSFGPGATPQAVQAEGTVAFSGERPHGRPAFAPANGRYRAAVDLPARNGIHNVTVTVTGTLPDGSTFERTLVRSFAAVARADRGKWQGN